MSELVPLNLADQQYFITTTDTQNRYLNIKGLNDVVGSGTYSFLIAGSRYLQKDAEVRFEAIDANGRQIPVNGVRELLRGTSRIVTFTIDGNISNGIATLYISTILETYDNNGIESEVPADVKNTDNLLFTYTFQIDKTFVNTDQIIFQKTPIGQVTPLLKLVRDVTKEGQVKEAGISIESIRYNRSTATHIVNITGPIGFFDKNMEGATAVGSYFNAIQNRDENIISGTLRVLAKSNTNALLIVRNSNISSVSRQEMESRIKRVRKITITYSPYAIRGSVDIQEKAYGDFVIKNMGVVSGDVAKVKIFGRTEHLGNDYVFLSEQDVIAKNLLFKEDVGDVGAFLSSDVLNYWEAYAYEGGDQTEDPQLQIDNLVFYSGSSVIGVSGFDGTPNALGGFRPYDDLLLIPRYVVKTKLDMTLFADTEYRISLDAAVNNVPTLDRESFLTFGYKNPRTRMDVYVSGSGLPPEGGCVNKLGTLVYSFETERDRTWENNFDIRYNREVDLNDAELVFAITTGDWYFTDVKLTALQEQGFSPEEFRFQIPIEVIKPNQKYDFKIEFFDPNNNKADFELFIENIEFEKPNVVMEGRRNVLSGSLFVGDGYDTGVELGLSGDGGFISSVYYQGFEEAITVGGNPGFLIYSGSVFPESATIYNGVGVEFVKDESNYFKFNTDPGLFEVITEKFFVGDPDTQFISGSDSNIEISASNFHLDPKNNKLIIKGALFVDSNGEEIQTFQYRGQWQEGNLYIVDDIVYYEYSGSTQTYICVQEHTSQVTDPDGPPEPDSNDNWEPFISSGTDGSDARAVNITASDQSIIYNTDGSSPNPSTVTITAGAVNTEGTVYYEFLVNSITVQNTTSNTYTLSVEADISNMPQIVEVKIREDSNTGTVLATDQTTVYGIRNGANGADAYTVILSNEAHSLPTTNTGTITYDGSGTEIIVYKGTTQLDSVSGTPVAGEFSVSAVGTNITPDSSPNLSGLSAIYGNASNFGTFGNDTYITFTVNVENNASITKRQSLTLSIEGQDGTPGAPGAPGATGDPGPSITFRGLWESGESYVATSIRKDVVQYLGTYYLCNTSHTSTTTGTNGPPGVGSYWDNFGGNFESVATDILFAQEAYINKTLGVGTDGGTNVIFLDPDENNSYQNPFISIGQGGTKQYNQNGIYIGYSSATPVLSLVNTSTNKALKWNGSELQVTGSLFVTDGVIGTVGAGTNGGTIADVTTLYDIYGNIAKYGDVNLNGTINAEDATAVLQHVVGKITLSSYQQYLAEVSGDGTINSFDALQILTGGGLTNTNATGASPPFYTGNKLEFNVGGDFIKGTGINRNSTTETFFRLSPFNSFINVLRTDFLSAEYAYINTARTSTIVSSPTMTLDTSYVSGGDKVGTVTLHGGLVIKNTQDSRGNSATGDATHGLTVDDSISINGNIYAAGSISATGDVIAYSTSDKNFKDNIIPITDSINKVKQIGGYEFDWNDKQQSYQGHDVGVIAQEVEQVLPEVVTTRDDGSKAVKYDKIVPLLIEAIKELSNKIDELENKLNK